VRIIVFSADPLGGIEAERFGADGFVVRGADRAELDLILVPTEIAGWAIGDSCSSSSGAGRTSVATIDGELSAATISRRPIRRYLHRPGRLCQSEREHSEGS
jgi:hypothetical protein